MAGDLSCISERASDEVQGADEFHDCVDGDSTDVEDSRQGADAWIHHPLTQHTLQICSSTSRANDDDPPDMSRVNDDDPPDMSRVNDDVPQRDDPFAGANLVDQPHNACEVRRGPYNEVMSRISSSRHENASAAVCYRPYTELGYLADLKIGYHSLFACAMAEQLRPEKKAAVSKAADSHPKVPSKPVVVPSTGERTTT
jgi:hypothetical protein